MVLTTKNGSGRTNTYVVTRELAWRKEACTGGLIVGKCTKDAAVSLLSRWFTPVATHDQAPALKKHSCPLCVVTSLQSIHWFAPRLLLQNSRSAEVAKVVVVVDQIMPRRVCGAVIAQKAFVCSW